MINARYLCFEALSNAEHDQINAYRQILKARDMRICSVRVQSRQEWRAK